MKSVQIKTQIKSLFYTVLVILLVAGCSSSDRPKDGASDATFVSQHLEAEEEPQYMIGETAPNFSLIDLNGNTTSLEALQGKLVVIHFATTWCPFCNAEAPTLEKIYQQYQSQGVEVLIIDVKESPKLVRRKLQDRFNFTFPVLLDPEGEVAASYAPEGVLPDLTRDEVVLASNLLIDRSGKIQFYSLLNSQDFDSKLIALKARLNELL